jgi:hypothetical protein
MWRTMVRQPFNPETEPRKGAKAWKSSLRPL